jgi:hypothetical protein
MMRDTGCWMLDARYWPNHGGFGPDKSTVEDPVLREKETSFLYILAFAWNHRINF